MTGGYWCSLFECGRRLLVQGSADRVKDAYLSLGIVEWVTCWICKHTSLVSPHMWEQERQEGLRRELKCWSVPRGKAEHCMAKGRKCSNH